MDHSCVAVAGLCLSLFDSMMASISKVLATGTGRKASNYVQPQALVDFSNGENLIASCRVICQQPTPGAGEGGHEGEDQRTEQNADDKDKIRNPGKASVLIVVILVQVPEVFALLRPGTFRDFQGLSGTFRALSDWDSGTSRLRLLDQVKDTRIDLSHHAHLTRV